MDQLKAMLPAIKQHSFWGMCIGILAVSVASWWMSTGALKTEEQAKKSNIESNFKAVEGIRSANQKHPNQFTHQGMDGLLAMTRQDVEKGWQMQYDNQLNVLVWPASFDQEFHDAVNKMRPIEAIPVTATGQIEFSHDLPVELRTIYRNYIEFDLPNLAKTIGTVWVATSKGVNSGSGAAGGAAMPMAFGGDPTGGVKPEDNSVVVWSASNQQEIMQTHFGFTARTENPTTLEVLYAQEDLWVLQNIMDIIRLANDNAEARHEAAIKEVEFIRVGRSALGLAGSITPVGTSGGQGAGETTVGIQGPVAGGEAPMNPMGPMGGLAEGGGGLTLTDPAEGRYVDEVYQPLRSQRLRGALNSRDEKDALLAVAKRMPVRMRFKLDQRKLNRLLAECGNSKLPVEIRQIRINRPPAASGGGGMSEMGGIADYGGAAGAEGIGMFGGGQRGAGNEISDASIDRFLIDVEVYGVVYIYNPVNKMQLGLPTAPATAMTPVAPSPPSAPVSPTSTGAALTPATAVAGS